MAKFALGVVIALGMAGCADRGPLSDAERESRILEMVDEYQNEFPDVPQISVDAFVASRNAADVVLLDVREPEERSVSTIPGSISREEFEARKREYAGRRVITYCTIGYRSSEYAQKLREEGFDAWNLEGSILAWVNAGQPVEDEAGRTTKRVHTYGSRWALLPEGYEAVY